jgi:hypothetical protein
MPSIVLVHGIAQEQLGADTLESTWLPALASGVRTAGHPQLADLIWRAAAPGKISVRMAYYGDLFLTPGTMGVDSLNPASAEQRDLGEQLASEWLARAADRDVPEYDGSHDADLAGQTALTDGSQRQITTGRGSEVRRSPPPAARAADFAGALRVDPG